MKKNIFKFLAAIVVCGFAMTLFTQCNRDEEDNTVTDDVRLTQIYAEGLNPVNGDIIVAATRDFVWENGLLKGYTLDMPSVGGISTSETHYYYSGNNCVEIHTIFNCDNHQYFTYNGERMTKAVEIDDGDTTRIATIHSYTDDGHVKSMTVQTIKFGRIIDIIDYEFTWENGDLTTFRTHRVGSDDEDVICTRSYDNYPNIYTGVPLADYIFAPDEMAFRGSKHNCLSDGSEYTYANGRLVAETGNTSRQYFTFSDGTTGRP
jgi:hypothetical protein